MVCPLVVFCNVKISNNKKPWCPCVANKNNSCYCLMRLWNSFFFRILLNREWGDRNIFHLGYDYKTITNMLQVYHGITMSVRTLKRRLQSYILVKRKNSVNEALIRNVIRREMQGPGQLAGYRKMWHILRIKHHVHAPRWLGGRVAFCSLWHQRKWLVFTVSIFICMHLLTDPVKWNRECDRDVSLFLLLFNSYLDKFPRL